MSDAPVRFADILSALSYALDLVEGQAVGHAVRTCLIAMRVGNRLGLTEGELADLYFAALLKDAGCSSNSVRIHAAFGDDHAAKHAVKLIDWTKKFDCLMYGLRNTHPGKSLPKRVVKMIETLNDREASMAALTQARCDRGAKIALQLGFGAAVAEAVLNLDEHWDGLGAPSNKKGEEIPIIARILCLAQTLDVLVPAVGRTAAFRTIKKRSGRWFDPAVASAAMSLENDHEFWYGMADDARGRALELATPATLQVATEVSIDSTCDAFASIIDAKSSFTASHSQRVTQYSVEMGQMLSFEAPRLALLRRAALLHDIGKLGVPTAVLEKPGKLTEGEFGIIRDHPSNTQRILGMIGGFDRVTEIAAAHHERLDGRGYHRGLPAEMLDTDMRILAVADVFDALSAERPYRGALPMSEVFAIMEREGPAALDPDLVGLMKDKYMGSSELLAA